MVIIDEIFMVSCGIIAGVDMAMRVFSGRDVFMGGKRVLFMGDARQIPPVCEYNHETEIISQCFLNHDPCRAIDASGFATHIDSATR